MEDFFTLLKYLKMVNTDTMINILQLFGKRARHCKILRISRYAFRVCAVCHFPYIKAYTV
jgi:hypothetical protein